MKETFFLIRLPFFLLGLPFAVVEAFFACLSKILVITWKIGIELPAFLILGIPIGFLAAALKNRPEDFNLDFSDYFEAVEKFPGRLTSAFVNPFNKLWIWLERGD